MKRQSKLCKAFKTAWKKSSTRLIVILSILVIVLFLISMLLYLNRPRFDERGYPEFVAEKYEIGNPKSFFENLGPLAQAIGKEYQLFPSVMLAQAALETGYGKSKLSAENYNFFGMKSYGDHDEVDYLTTEFYEGQETQIVASFKAYVNPIDSFIDYAKLITGAKRYAEVTQAKTAQLAAKALQDNGYATDPDYAEKLIMIIRENNLERFDPQEVQAKP